MVLEAYFEQIFLAGVVALVVGAAWMIIAAFSTHWKWGVGVLVFPPVSIWFTARNLRRGLPPLLLIFAGLLGMSGPAIWTRMARVDLGPYENFVEGQRHLTLTGWDRQDYSFLKFNSDVAVLQMANADVTDDTLSLLAGMTALKELDISNSQVTDAGLAALTQLPKLEILRVANTRITDEGFRQHLIAHPALSQIDATGTAVTIEFINWAGENSKLQIMN